MASISIKDEGVSKTEILIRETCAEFADFLCEKNRKYGNAALDPVAIFSKSDPLETIRVRIDDKLNRIINQQVDEDEDVIKDLIGYFLLYKVAEKVQANKNKAFDPNDYQLNSSKPIATPVEINAYWTEKSDCVYGAALGGVNDYAR